MTDPMTIKAHGDHPATCLCCEHAYIDAPRFCSCGIPGQFQCLKGHWDYDESDEDPHTLVDKAQGCSDYKERDE